MKLQDFQILIESKWNLNYPSWALQNNLANNINRIKVEFKLRRIAKHTISSPDINRIKVEFKFATQIAIKSRHMLY